MNKTKIKLIFFLLVLPCFGISQVSPSVIDSLQQEVLKTTDQEKRYELYKELSKSFIYSDLEISKLYSDSMLQIGEALKDEDKIMSARYNYSVIFRSKGELDKALIEQKKYLNYTLTNTDTLKISMAHYQIGATQMRLGKMDESMENFIKALEYSESIEDHSLSSKIMNGIAIIHKHYEHFDQALDYYRRSEKINQELKDTNSLAVLNNGIGVVLLRLEQRDEALECFEKSLAYSKKMNNVALEGFQYRNLGKLYLEDGNFELAEEYLLKALDFRIKFNDQLALAGSHHDLGELYRKMGKLDQSEIHLNKSLELLKEIGADVSSNTIYDQLIKLHEKKGDYKKAFEYLQIYEATMDSLTNIDVQARISEIQTKYETEKQAKELIEKDYDLKKQTNSKRMYGAIAGGLLIALLGLWYSFYQRQKRKNEEFLSLKREHQIKSLESLIEGEEKERTRIARELHDGINGDLSAIKFKLAALQEKNETIINEAIDMIDKSCEQVRNISHNLLPPSLENLEIAETIANYCHRMDGINDIKINFQFLGDAIIMNRSQEINIFRIVQELVGNAIKHSKTNEINVQISNRNKHFQLTVEDNGIGFDMKTIQSEGMGLQNIKSRVDYLNATLDHSSSAKGTSFVVDMDL